MVRGETLEEISLDEVRLDLRQPDLLTARIQQRSLEVRDDPITVCGFEKLEVSGPAEVRGLIG